VSGSAVESASDATVTPSARCVFAIMEKSD
jgi:hypothetical protein